MAIPNLNSISRRRFMAGTAATALLGAPSIVRGQAPALKIAVLLPRSGYLAQAGQSCHRGALIAPKVLADFGHKVELVHVDIESNADIARTQAEIGALSHPDRLFRPTGGGGHLDRRLLSPEAAALLEAGGFTCVLWNAIPRDWADPEGWVATALAQLARQPWTLMVLHDLPSGAMHQLDRFLAEVTERGGRLRQDFPASCLPITRGRISGPLTDFVNSASGVRQK